MSLLWTSRKTRCRVSRRPLHRLRYLGTSRHDVPRFMYYTLYGRRKRKAGLARSTTATSVRPAHLTGDKLRATIRFSFPPLDGARIVIVNFLDSVTKRIDIEADHLLRQTPD